jgi:hypothetical protein
MCQIATKKKTKEGADKIEENCGQEGGVDEEDI